MHGNGRAGWMLKKGCTRSNWKNRYCEVKAPGSGELRFGELNFYTDCSKKKLRGTVLLSEAEDVRVSTAFANGACTRVRDSVHGPNVAFPCQL